VTEASLFAGDVGAGMAIGDRADLLASLFFSLQLFFLLNLLLNLLLADANNLGVVVVVVNARASQTPAEEENPAIWGGVRPNATVVVVTNRLLKQGEIH